VVRKKKVVVDSTLFFSCLSLLCRLSKRLSVINATAEDVRQKLDELCAEHGKGEEDFERCDDQIVRAALVMS
jgi:hypothetical protein